MQGFSSPLDTFTWNKKCLTNFGGFEKGGELTRRGIWDAQATGLEEGFWPKRRLGGLTEEDMEPYREEKDKTQDMFAYMLRDFRYESWRDSLCNAVVWK